MAALATPAPRKLPVWSTVGACYVAVARNIGQLVRICWLWLLIMVPIYAAELWLVSTHWATRNEQTMSPWLGSILTALPLIVELPFLASIAVAWHRLVLRQERVSASAYLKLDTVVWLYALCSLGFLALTTGPALSALEIQQSVALDLHTQRLQLSILLASLLLTVVAGLLVVPRLSLVLPAVAVREPLSLRQAWRITRGNAVRLAQATCLCMLPATLLLLLPVLVLLLLPTPWFVEASQEWPWMRALSRVSQLLNSLGYAIFNAIAYALLTIFAVTLLSLTYRFFAAPGGENASPPA
jgi:hypothetical protein